MILHLAKEVEEVYAKNNGSSQSVLAGARGLPRELHFQDASSKMHVGLGEWIGGYFSGQGILHSNKDPRNSGGSQRNGEHDGQLSMKMPRLPSFLRPGRG